MAELGRGDLPGARRVLAGEGDYAGANPEDPDEYKPENVFWVPAEARWPIYKPAPRNQ